MNSRPIEILLVEDNPGDARLTLEAFKEGKVFNNLTVVGTEWRPWRISAARAGTEIPCNRI